MHCFRLSKRFQVVMLLLVLGSASIFLLRLRRLVEYQVYFGDEAQRLAICRSIPLIHPGRQPRLLLRLLADGSPEVRSSAVTAAERGRRTVAVEARLLALVEDSQETGIVRDKAGLVLLGQAGSAAARLHQLLRAHLAEPNLAFEQACPGLVAHYLFGGWQLGEVEGGLLLRRALAPDDAVGERLQDLLPAAAAGLQAFRPELVAHLEQLGGAPETFRRRRFVLACLQGIDGAMRGVSAADWVTLEEPGGAVIDGHLFEAEWASAIEPNYQIGIFNDRLCLMLGEGAGGIISWLKAERGSVDIGRARLSCVIAEAGEYRVWARVYFDDKCGNSFGFELAGQKFGGFSDYHDILGDWHWLLLTPVGRQVPEIFLERGVHAVRLEAWEDAVYIDQIAVLKAKDDPRRYAGATNHYWLPEAVPAVSLAPEWQAQLRGSRQRLAVWVLRPSPTMASGTVTLTVAPPFKITSFASTQVVFAPGQPLGRTSFEIELPAAAVGGEIAVQARFVPVGEDETAASEAQIILGAQFDWLTTGPLSPTDELHLALAKGPRLSDDQLREGWFRYPATGYDPYRRLIPEAAWGELQNQYMYFCADIEVAEAGTYMALLNSDDSSTVWMDGVELVSQPRNGPAEGRLVMQPVKLEAGRHRLLAQLFQADLADAQGNDASRQNQNHCAFKLLLRRSRHQFAPEIRGLPMDEVERR